MIRILIVTVLGLGYLRPAPGTWGSLPPCLFAFLCVVLGAPYWVLQGGLLATTALACYWCVRHGRWAERKYRTKDPGVVVIDEVAGMALTLLLLPATLPLASAGREPGDSGGLISGMVVIAAAFLLFRIFDIIKIPPANLMQQFRHGWGILLDDIVAGLLANLLLQFTLRLVLPMLIDVS